MDDTTPLSPGRRPRNWEVLKALESVSPPSPSPSYGSDFLATLASSGEIPIFLDSGDDQNGLEDLSSFSPQKHLPVPSYSVDTVQTVGTFGPRRTLLQSANQARNSYGSQRSYTTSHTETDSGFITPSQSAQFLSPHSPTMEHGYYDKRVSSASSRFTLSAYLSPRRKRSTETSSLPGSPCLSPSGSIWNTSSPSSDTLNLPDRSPSIGASLSTIIFAAGSGAVSPTVSAGLATEAQLYASRHRQQSGSGSTTPTRIDFPTAGENSADPGRSLTTSFFTSRSRPHCPLSSPALRYPGPRVRTRSSATAKSNDSGRSGHSEHSARSNQSSQSARIGPLSGFRELTVQVPGLPPVLSWLEDVQLELWIDQEGFRLARPAFTLSGYTTVPASDREPDLVEALTYGSAEFKPLERQQFIFHHHALDPPPVLRKLTMAGDDSRDYISRQASLSIKANGVYSVSGTEHFDSGPPSPHNSVQHNSAHHALRLTWRFDYLVEDSVGKGRHGDKTLTPLAFACSPGVLHPTHGKKIRIMQVVKKNLTPKLTSEKMEGSKPELRIRVQTDPPGEAPRYPAQRDGRDGDLKPPQPGGAVFGHRRARSTSPLLSHENQHEPGSEGNRSGAKKNRTASLAIGSRVEHRPVNGDPLVTSFSANRRNSADPPGDPVRQLSRHILPPTDLAIIMDEPTRHPEAVAKMSASLHPPPRKRR